MADTTFQRTLDELDALVAYFDGLSAMADAAIGGEGPIPVIPPLDELQVVDGWVVWNGEPVWSPVTEALTRAQPLRAGTVRDAMAAWAAAEHRALDIAQAVLDQETEEVIRGDGSPEEKARERAEHGFYSHMLARLRYAIDHPARLPEVPPAEELEFVDGWLIWRGERVWWSGQGPGPSRTASLSTASHASRTTPAPARERLKLRRLLTLPWRRATA